MENAGQVLNEKLEGVSKTLDYHQVRVSKIWRPVPDLQGVKTQSMGCITCQTCIFSTIKIQ